MGAQTLNSVRDKYLAYYFQSRVLKFSIKLNSRSMDLVHCEEENTKFLAWTLDLLLVDVV